MPGLRPEQWGKGGMRPARGGAAAPGPPAGRAPPEKHTGGVKPEEQGMPIEEPQNCKHTTTESHETLG